MIKMGEPRYVPGGSYAVTMEFICTFGERVRDTEEMSGGTLNHSKIFAQFVHAVTTVNTPASSYSCLQAWKIRT